MKARTSIITHPDHRGRRQVWFLVDGHWLHKGWLMPQVGGRT